MVISTSNTGTSGNTEFTIPTNSSYTYDYEVDWTYDGTTFMVEDDNVTGDITHTYASAGTYTIAIRGQFPQMYFNDNPNDAARASDAQKLVGITQWGDIAWTDFEFSFLGCLNLTGSPLDVPDLSGVTSLRGAFGFCTSMNMDMTQWDVSTIQNFRSAFREAHLFNRDISGWDVSAGTNFSRMFDQAYAFNQNLGSWDLSQATNLENFLDDAGLDQGHYDVTLDGWAAQSLPSGLTVGVNNLVFCQGETSRKILTNDLSWSFVGDQKDCPFVIVVKTDNPGDFSSNTEYQIPTYPSASYDYQVDWTYDGTTFNVEDDNITGNITHDYGTPGTYTIAIRGAFPGIYNNETLANADPEKLIEVQQWGSMAWELMAEAFSDCVNLELTAPDLPDLSGVFALTNLFNNCSSFSGHPSMAYWDVSTILDFGAVFTRTEFNQDISRWDVSSGTDFTNMFLLASPFNQDISGWDVSAGTRFGAMFYGATAFNQDISGWDVSAGIEFLSMFFQATAFNQDISGWDVSAGTDFGTMFFGASAFNQDLGSWDIAQATDLDNMLDNCGMDVANYDATLIGWALQPAVPTGVELGAAGLNYCYGKRARDSLIIAHGWTITGDQLDCPPPFVMVIKTDNAGSSANDQFTIPTFPGETYNYQVDWEYDGTTFTTDDAGVSGSITHTYPAPGTYTVAIRESRAGNTFPSIYFNNAGDKEKVLEIQQWGHINWASMSRAFWGCTQMELTATDLPDLEEVTDFSFMFAECSNMAGNINIAGWDVSSGTDFSAMFLNALDFNQDIGQWDVSTGTNFSFILSGAIAFNYGLGNWNLSQATNLGSALDFAGLSLANYDATLIGWAAQTPPNDLTLGAAGLAYCSGASARAALLSTYGWTINGDQLDCAGSGGGNTDCPDHRFVIQSDITTDTTLSAGSILESSGTVTITAGQNVTFTAGQTITLKPGFTAAGPFSAVIENCPPMMAAADEQIATDQPAAPLVELPSGKNGPVVALEVVPNPAYDQTNLRFDLTEPSTASLTLHSLKGETLRTLLHGHPLAAGRQQISLRTNDLPPGLYLVRLQTAQGVQTAKVIVTPK